MRKRTQYCFGALAIALALAAPGPGYAQSSDPQVDPDSPAGTEYELPLDRAREEAGGGSTGAGSGGTGGEAPLFGEGVESGAGAAESAPKQGTDSDPATTASIEPDGASDAPETVRAQAPSPDGGGGDLVAIGAGSGGVLLLGGLAGLVWRRRSVQA